MAVCSSGSEFSLPDSPAESPNAAEEGSIAEDENGIDKSTGRILIAYFSRSGNTENYPDGIDAVSTASLIEKNGLMVGNTEYLADLIQQSVGGDQFLIEVEEQYPADYDATVERAEKENSDNIRPALASHLENPEEYEYVFPGFPNWLAYHNLIQCTQA